VFRANDEDAARILSEADGCLYEAKNNGRDCVVVSETAKRGTLWKAGMLQHALQENRVVPAFQVMVDLRTEAVVADEALARLVQSDGEIVAAGDFVEAAEGINLIHIVDGVITRKALQRHAAEVSGGTLSHARAHFINLSPQFLARPEMVQKLLEEAQRYCDSCGVKFGAIKPLVFEITERQLVGDLDDLVRDLQPLLDFGFQLALDDFGSGYSSFLYLAKLPVSFLKIEGWMISNMRQNPRVLAMVRSIIMLARNQGITTIAEGIEDAETAEMLRAMGVDWGQGYYFGRPECAPVKSVEMVYS
jgi:EAL domain-containing protein (putative c-di-GMP-specific phosphodiesterase class I)